MAKLALANRIEAYNLPLGVISQLYREIAGRKPGVITKVGLAHLRRSAAGRRQDQRISTEDLVEVIELGGEEWLFYKAFPIHVAFCRGTTADPDGNITMEREALTLDNLAMAMAAKNSGGLVIVQVERIAEAGSLNPRQVKIPGILVDCVVVPRPEYHWQTYGNAVHPGVRGEMRVPLDSLPPLPLDERKVIARRCAFELPPGGVVNLGIGMPEGVASVANEEQVLHYVTLTAEPGAIGGVPQAGSTSAPASTPTRSSTRTSSSTSTTAAGSTWRASAWPNATRRATSTSAASARSWPAPAASSTSARTRARSSSPARSPPAA